MGRVTAPICMRAILDIAVYMFVGAFTTVSAAAMATEVFATALGVKLLHLALTKWVFGRLQTRGQR
jgi:iron(III) transport system permease protein